VQYVKRDKGLGPKPKLQA